VAGASVSFTRTGGASTTLPSASAVTDSAGAFVLRLGPITEGPVVGDLTIQAPGAATSRVVKGATIGSSLELPDTLSVFLAVPGATSPGMRR
jgi:hypothetical protein